MKNRFSLIIVILLGVVLSLIRFYTPNDKVMQQIQVTTWDALGYYMYLPASYIYNDEDKLNWFPTIDSMYAVSGGQFYQANRQDNGKFVNKYLMGVSILQTPFFLLAHAIAPGLGYPADGFSLPYQWAIAWGCIFWVLISLVVLRTLLLNYFSDIVVAFVLVLLMMSTNLIQYVAIEGGQSHGWIFPLYVFLLYATFRWHQKPTFLVSGLIGLLIGVAVISRPTEAVMLMIPIFWVNDTMPNLKAKWNYFKSNPKHVWLVALGLIIGILPQLLYWKRVTGHFVYDVGSKWDFLNPHFRVLFGWEKGWLVYTPITILFIVGLFFLKKYPFSTALKIFCFFNIYIIISWHVWRYGGSYSCRALVQSYPVMVFALAALLQLLYERKWLLYLIPFFGFVVYVNMFQIRQYNEGVLHYDEMNRKYYGAIYLNEEPSPLDMSLLDTDEQMNDEERKQVAHFATIHEPKKINDNEPFFLQQVTQNSKFKKGSWMNLKTTIRTEKGLWGSFLCVSLISENEIKETKIRLFNVLCEEGKSNQYEMDVRLPATFQLTDIEIFVAGNNQFEGQLEYLFLTKNWVDGF